MYWLKSGSLQGQSLDAAISMSEERGSGIRDCAVPFRKHVAPLQARPLLSRAGTGSVGSPPRTPPG